MQDLSLFEDPEIIGQWVGNPQKFEILRPLGQNEILDVQSNGNRDLFESVDRVHLGCQLADEKNNKSKNHGKGARASFNNHFSLLAKPGIHPRNPLKRI